MIVVFLVTLVLLDLLLEGLTYHMNALTEEM